MGVQAGAAWEGLVIKHHQETINLAAMDSA